MLFRSASFPQTGGTLTGSGTLNVGGGGWSGGTMSGSGKTSITATASFAISGASQKTLDTRTFENNGATSWSGSGALAGQNGAALNNQSGASFTIQGDASLTTSGAAVTFTNATGATLTKNTTSGTTTIGASFTHSGTANISTGTLALAGTATLNATIGGAGTLASAPWLFKKPTIDPKKDFIYIAPLLGQAFILSVDAATPYKTVADLTAAMKQKKDKASYATPNNSSTILAELYKQAAGLETTQVNYRTSADFRATVTRPPGRLPAPRWMWRAICFRTKAWRAMSGARMGRAQAHAPAPRRAACGGPG